MAAKETRILIMAGGTGGHVFPALAVADKLRESGVKVEWLGTERGIESTLVPKAGIKLNYLDIAGLRGKGAKAWLKMPWQLSSAVWQASRVIRRFKPDAVLGLGGFASGPGGLAARMLGKPLVVHEQNAIPGTTNRWLAKMAVRRLEAFPNALPNAEQVGNPVRADIVALPEPQLRMQDREGAPRLLVLGGSMGALKLNELVPAALAGMDESQRPLVWHQAGRAHLSVASKAYADAGIDARVDAFIDNMAEAYGWADLVICRAGALTVSEITAAGLAALFVPYPYATDDHQTRNAEWLVSNHAAVIRQERELNTKLLRTELTALLSSPERLMTMAVNARSLAMPRAAERVAEICLEVANG